MVIGDNRFFRTRNAVLLTLVSGLAVTGALGWQLHREAVAMDRQRLALRTAEIQSQLDTRLEKSEMLLQHLRDYLMFSRDYREPVFARWCKERGLLVNCPWIHGILVATNRTGALWRETLPNPPETWTATDWQTFSALSRGHPIECGIAMISRIDDSKRFLADYDLRGTKQQKSPFAHTVSNARLGMSERRTVMLDVEGNAILGTFFIVPVYDAESADLLDGNMENRRRNGPVRWLNLNSVILAPVDFNRLTKSVWGGHHSDVGIELFPPPTRRRKPGSTFPTEFPVPPIPTSRPI